MAALGSVTQHTTPPYPSVVVRLQYGYERGGGGEGVGAMGIELKMSGGTGEARLASLKREVAAETSGKRNLSTRTDKLHKD